MKNPNRINLYYLLIVGMVITATSMIIWAYRPVDVLQPAEPLPSITYYDTVYFDHGDGMILRERDQFFNDSTFVNHSEIR